ncbi:hypothetical protein C8F01DRAFT_1137539 [Mycena amicta]|nr:hypothetical protein C8F01DRAFT_1137539 [Mycena amicta]
MMAAVPGLRIIHANAVPGLEELLQTTKETGIRSLKIKDPLSVVEMALAVEIERARATEALAARDAAIHHLSEACASIHQKIILIEQLQQGAQGNPHPVATPVNEQVVALEMTVKTLREEILALRSAPPVKVTDPPPSYDENGIDHKAPLIRPASSAAPLRMPARDLVPRPATASSVQEHVNARVVLDENDLDSQIIPTTAKSLEPEDIIKARHALLATIPLPIEPPDDTLKPIVIPPPFTLHEFLANASGVSCMAFFSDCMLIFLSSFYQPLRNALSNYRVLQELTTSWCPEREEHGYTLTPLFKCSTNPRVATAHRWNMVDVMARMGKPSECFYNKDGNWYYAGVYKGFRLANLTVKEWEALSSETTQALVKETIAGRKNTSPQNMYETAQMYGAGALRVACIGLQCVGFNKAVYHAVLEQAARCVDAASAGGGSGSGAKWSAQNGTKVGLGNGGAWNVAAGELADGMAAMVLSDGSEKGNQEGHAPTDKRKET